jgi:hypothetical protein
MTQLHATHKETPWAAKFGWFNHGRCQKAMALRGMKDNVSVVTHSFLLRLARALLFALLSAILSHTFCSVCDPLIYVCINVSYPLFCAVILRTCIYLSLSNHSIIPTTSFFATHRARAYVHFSLLSSCISTKCMTATYAQFAVLCCLSSLCDIFPLSCVFFALPPCCIFLLAFVIVAFSSCYDVLDLNAHHMCIVCYLCTCAALHSLLTPDYSIQS